MLLVKAVFFVGAGLHEDVEGVVDVVDGQTVGLDGRIASTRSTSFMLSPSS